MANHHKEDLHLKACSKMVIISVFACKLKALANSRGSYPLADMETSDNPCCVVYAEYGSKNRYGDLSDFRRENKGVSCYAVRETIPKYLVFLLNLYMKKLPKYAFENHLWTKYIHQRIQMYPSMKRLWLICKDTLFEMVKEMCAEAKIDKYMNHSFQHFCNVSCLESMFLKRSLVYRSFAYIQTGF